MPHGSVTESMPASCTEVFLVLHDYDRRLAWDTLLRDAYLCDNVTKARLHAKVRVYGPLVSGRPCAEN